MNQTHFSPKPMVIFLSEGWFHCQSCNPRLVVKADGTDQPVVGQAYDTISVSEVDDRTIHLVIKKAGKIVLDETQFASPNGTKLTVKTTAFSVIGEPPVTVETYAIRNGIAPAAINRISGQWRLTGKRESENGLFVTYKSNGDELTMRQSDGQTYTAKFDGKDYPVKGVIGHDSVSLRRIDKNSFEEFDKREGNIVNITRVAVGANGRTMTIVETNKLTDRSSTYLAVKQ